MRETNYVFYFSSLNQNDDDNDVVLNEYEQLEFDRMAQDIAEPALPSVPQNENPATEPSTSIVDLTFSTSSGTSDNDDLDDAPTGVRILSPQANTGAVRKKSQPSVCASENSAEAAVAQKTAKRKPTVSAELNRSAPDKNVKANACRPPPYATVQEEDASILRRQYAQPPGDQEGKKRADECDQFLERYAKRNPDGLILILY